MGGGIFIETIWKGIRMGFCPRRFLIWSMIWFLILLGIIDSFYQADWIKLCTRSAHALRKLGTNVDDYRPSEGVTSHLGRWSADQEGCPAWMRACDGCPRQWSVGWNRGSQTRARVGRWCIRGCAGRRVWALRLPRSIASCRRCPRLSRRVASYIFGVVASWSFGTLTHKLSLFS